MKKYVFMLSLIVVLWGCNKKEDVGNLKEIARQHMYTNKSIDQSQGGDKIITDTLVCNDSVIIISSMYVLSNGNIIPWEDFFTRQRTSKGYVYRVDSRMLLDGITKSIAEEIEVNYISCNMTSLKMFLSNDKYNVFVNKLLYTKALAECIKMEWCLKTSKSEHEIKQFEVGFIYRCIVFFDVEHRCFHTAVNVA